MALTNVQLRAAKPREKAYKLADEKGLHLLVAPNGSNIGDLNTDLGAKKNSSLLGSILKSA